MIQMTTTTSFIQSPLAVTLIGAACVALLTIATAAIKIVIQLARMESAIQDIRGDIAGIKSDPDVMRWSNYGRAVQAGAMANTTPGATP